jgi:hypothetical protein
MPTKHLIRVTEKTELYIRPQSLELHDVREIMVLLSGDQTSIYR